MSKKSFAGIKREEARIRRTRTVSTRVDDLTLARVVYKLDETGFRPESLSEAVYKALIMFVKWSGGEEVDGSTEDARWFLHERFGKSLGPPEKKESDKRPYAVQVQTEQMTRRESGGLNLGDQRPVMNCRPAKDVSEWLNEELDLRGTNEHESNEYGEKSVEQLRLEDAQNRGFNSWDEALVAKKRFPHLGHEITKEQFENLKQQQLNEYTEMARKSGSLVGSNADADAAQEQSVSQQQTAEAETDTVEQLENAINQAQLDGDLERKAKLQNQLDKLQRL